MFVAALEMEARKRGGLTIYLGADNEKEDGEASFFNADLYNNLSNQIKHFNSGSHPSGFYMKLGYHIIGAMPDANGTGKPYIFSGKRL